MAEKRLAIVSISLLWMIVSFCTILADPLGQNNDSDDENYEKHLNNSPYTSYWNGNAARTRIKLIRTTRFEDDNVVKAPEMSYYATLAVGTPAKYFNVAFDTGSSGTWLPTYNWFPFANNLHYSTGYIYKDSSTSKCKSNHVSVDNRGTRFEGQIWEDAMVLHDHLGKDEAYLSPGTHIPFVQDFLLVSETSDEQFRYKPYDGVVGLAPVSTSNYGTRNVLLSIQAAQVTPQGLNEDEPTVETHYYGQGPVPSYLINQRPPAYPVLQPNGIYRPSPNFYNPYEDHYGHRERPTGLVNPRLDLIFAFWFNPNMNSRDGAELMLGDVDECRFKGPITYHRVNSWFDWELQVKPVQIGANVYSCAEGCNAKFDTSINWLLGPRSDVMHLYELLGVHYEQSTDMAIVDCGHTDRFPDLHFWMDRHSYSIPSSHYVKTFRFKDRFVCHLEVKPHDSQDWILGTTFFTAHYTVFNFSQRQIGFAAPQF